MPASFRKYDPSTERARIIHSGMIGTAKWTIDEDGLLVIGEGTLNTDDLPASTHPEGASSDRWPWYAYHHEIDAVDGSAPFKITGDLSYAFGGDEPKSISKRGLYTSIETMDLSGWDTSEVTSMRGLFYDCGGMTHVNVSSFDTGNVKDFSDLFSGCFSLHELDVTNFRTGLAEDMSGMFSSCYLITELDVSRFNTAQVKNMNGMFSFCHRLEELDLSRFDTWQVENMSFMFCGCRGLRKIDVSSFETERVKSFDFMFSDCSSLHSLDSGKFHTGQATTLFKMFSDAFILEDLNVADFNTQNARYTQKMFDGCQSLNRVVYGAGLHKTLKAFRTKFPRGKWYQNGKGPYSVSSLPVPEQGEKAVLTRKEK